MVFEGWGAAFFIRILVGLQAGVLFEKQAWLGAAMLRGAPLVDLRYSSSRSLSPRRSSSGFSRLRSDYSDRRRSPVEGRAASSGSTDSPGANKQR